MTQPVMDLAQRLTRSVRDQSHPNLRPRDAAALILLDRSGPAPKVLLGRRNPNHVFMPGKFVFPGGRVEPSDRLMPAVKPLRPDAIRGLMAKTQRPSAARAKAFALAAIRETSEETGFLVGVRRDAPPKIPNDLWDLFAGANVHPDLSLLHFVARAITPPRRPRRFDTRFFVADAETIVHRVDGLVGPDAELVELVWLPVSQAQRLDMPTITQVVLEELQARLARGLDSDAPVPFYQMRHGRFERELL